MVTYDRYDVVFQEIPNEVSLAFTIEGCPNRCKGCHSPHLRQQNGKELTKIELENILSKYKDMVTCILFLGGDAFHEEMSKLFIKSKEYGFKVAFYSGFDYINGDLVPLLDYYKFGSYKEELGGLNNSTTNQRVLKLIDISEDFYGNNKV